MTKLRIAEGLSLPLDAVTQTFGILSVRGAGKSNTAAVLAEEMFRAGLPFVVVDPVSSWWGLRSSGDGRGPGLAIPIFGGRRGDIPLEKTGGSVLADLVVEHRLSCVLDIAEFSEGDKIRLLIDFAERLYRKNEQPLHLILEEADDYIPQRPFREQARCLRAWENIVRRGRARGLGITMISQRSAAINKNVLTQIETLIVLRTTSPQDRKAIEAWVEYHGQSRELLESLPGLKDGEAWVWSPHWLGTLKRVQIRRRETFDSGATPKDIKGARPAATLADVDLGAVRDRMAATIERAKAEDPRELRRQLADLRAQLAQAQKAQPAAAPPEIVEVPVVSVDQVKTLGEYAGRIQAAGNAVVEFGRELGAALARVNHAGQKLAAAPPMPLEMPRAVTRPTRTVSDHRVSESSLDPGKVRILSTIAMLNARGIEVRRESVARWLGLHPNGGRFNKSLASLRDSRHLDGWTLTTAGANGAEGRETGPDAALLALQDDSQRRIFGAILEAKAPVSREDLAERLGLHPNGGRFNRNLAWLRDMGLIPDRAPIQPTPGALR